MQSKRNAQKDAQQQQENSAFLEAEAAAKAAAAEPQTEAAPEPKKDALKISETPQAPQNKGLVFETIDTGDFDVVEFSAEGETLVARYEGVAQFEGFVDENDNPKDMLVFREYGTGLKKVVNPSYSLEKMFVHKDSETKVEWDKNPIFQITFIEKVPLAKGHLKKFKFGIAYEG